MNINKTAEECIVESSRTLLKCFDDPEISIKQKQMFTKWIVCLLDYQDAINNNKQEQIDYFQQKLNLTTIPFYYKNGLQEFKNSNLFYNKIMSFKNLKQINFKYSTKQTVQNVNNFSNKFIVSIKNYNVEFQENFLESFKFLVYTIHYRLSYTFKKELIKTANSLIKILKTKICSNKEKKNQLLIDLILKENEDFFNKLEQVQLTNFIFKLEEIFHESRYQKIIHKKINEVIFSKPNKIKLSMNTILKQNNINLYDEIWSNSNRINEKKAKLIMHLLAYETYFVQGQKNYQTYEELVLKNIIKEDKYWIILHKYKIGNKITKHL